MPDRFPLRSLTRRQLLGYGGRAAAALPLLAVAPTLASHPAAGSTSPVTRANEWLADDALGAFDADDSPYRQVASPIAFTALGAHWAVGERADTDIHLEISVSGDGVGWTPWQTMHVDDHGVIPKGYPERAGRQFAELQHTVLSRWVRYRVTSPDGQPRPAPPDLRFVSIDTSDGPTAADLGGQLGAFAATMPRVVTRAGWGCDERLRFDKEGKEIWKPEYAIAEKIIIHHTETPNDQDPLQAMRAIYYYHAITRGWGDIGYNFLIDRNGVVYEGRFGGEHVIGGHAYEYNPGSVGIAVIGSFTATPDSPAAEAALVQLVAYKGRFIDPLGRYFFVDKMIPNIVGHRDVLSTACPGNAFYAHLPAIRQGASNILGVTPTMGCAITDIVARGTSAVVQMPYTVRVTVKNTGTSVIPSYYDAGLTYLEGDTYDSKGVPKVEGRFRIVADLDSGAGGANPYRWGFGRSLNPGETIEVVCRIAFKTTGSKRLRFGLVQENTGYKQQGLGGPAVQVVGNPADPLPQPVQNTADVVYFPESKHTLRGALRRYWEKFGDLAQFGYPLTEEFLEVSETDGEEYLVQYFERARFEYHPENAAPYDVLLGLLGRQFHAVDKPAAPIRDGTHIYFPQTGHNLGGGFRSYWEQYGGLFVYGYPITDEIAEKSRIDGKDYTVQYFERARFEYHPENPDKSRVLLGHLGRQLLQDRGWIR